MPIFEFKCLDCENLFELLIMTDQKTVEMKCPSCDSESFERVMSTTNFSMGVGGSHSRASSETKTCSGGSCTTYEIPGHTR